MKILIAIPCMEHVPVPFVESLMSLRHPEGAHVEVRFHKNSLVYDARNLLAIHAIKEEFNYVLWLDSDMIVPKDALIQLIDDIELDLSARMVTGLYVKRTFPTAPVIYKQIDAPRIREDGTRHSMIQEFTDYPEHNLFTIAGCGFGCVLTKVSLLRDVWDKFGPAFVPFAWAGEDISFCWRVNHLSDIPEPQRIWCDSNVSCGHIGSFLFTEQMLKRGDS